MRILTCLCVSLCIVGVISNTSNGVTSSSKSLATSFKSPSPVSTSTHQEILTTSTRRMNSIVKSSNVLASNSVSPSQASSSSVPSSSSAPTAPPTTSKKPTSTPSIPPPHPKDRDSKRRFDTGSFIGGMIVMLVIVVIVFVVKRYFRGRPNYGKLQ